MLELAKCIECGEVKPRIGFRWHSYKTRENGVNYYCPECVEATDEWLDSEIEKYYGWLVCVGSRLGVKGWK